MIFTGEVLPGIYRLNSRMPATWITAAASEYNWQGFVLDGRAVQDKDSFMQVCAAALHFPSYFGYNWDAFEECLTDLSWAPAHGYLILYDDVWRFAHHAPHDWATALIIFRNAAALWQARGVPMIVLLRRTGGAVGVLPTL
jgi:hypothetical protein